MALRDYGPRMRDPELPDIQVRIRFEGAKAFSALLIADTLDAVEAAIFEVEEDEVNELSNELRDIPESIFDAIRLRIERLEGQTLRVEHASAGSLVIEGTVAYAALWLFKETIGETLKEAYRDSNMHIRLKKFLLRNHKKKAEQIVKRILRKLDVYQVRFLRRRRGRVPTTLFASEMKVEIRHAGSIDVLITAADEALPTGSEAMGEWARRGNSE